MVKHRWIKVSWGLEDWGSEEGLLLRRVGLALFQGLWPALCSSFARDRDIPRPRLSDVLCFAAMDSRSVAVSGQLG